jgi:hypothetical protein
MLATVAVRAERPEVLRRVVGVIAVAVMHVKLTRVLSHEPAPLAAVSLGRTIRDGKRRTLFPRDPRPPTHPHFGPLPE